jgi:hypothetical protein
MPTHARQQIREAAATVVSGLTTTGTRVYQSRMRPVADAGTPCLLVMTSDESIDPATVYTQQQRSLRQPPHVAQQMPQIPDSSQRTAVLGAVHSPIALEALAHQGLC